MNHDGTRERNLYRPFRVPAVWGMAVPGLACGWPVGMRACGTARPQHRSHHARRDDQEEFRGVEDMSGGTKVGYRVYPVILSPYFETEIVA
ncbi:MAG: hypothetical protein DWI29_05395 [Planctomycetota bacterium]|nr:MAG: hypothetical protein DWI29_05395 [Planctomycetota bacterium]